MLSLVVHSVFGRLWCEKNLIEFKSWDNCDNCGGLECLNEGSLINVSYVAASREDNKTHGGLVKQYMWMERNFNVFIDVTPSSDSFTFIINYLYFEISKENNGTIVISNDDWGIEQNCTNCISNYTEGVQAKIELQFKQIATNSNYFIVTVYYDDVEVMEGKFPLVDSGEMLQFEEEDILINEVKICGSTFLMFSSGYMLFSITTITAVGIFFGIIILSFIVLVGFGLITQSN